ncbi:putative acetyltransferase [Aminobacter lissarensis]|uniref:Acetyltransferase n=1 Tax=Aminobacter carboxidus TaxID=376165 RepID=A0A8E1W9L3_9HYPH|nr:GNAT family N-acetyltransferase [Aminobacter lissarensis]MBB6464580.1 putative acetyltransferase [Aminobacter lissarensis]
MTHIHGAAIRAYCAADRDRLAQVWLEASRIGHPFMSEAELLDQQARVRDIYLPQAENWVVELDGEPAGFIGLIDDFIGGLFVDPAAHGQGFGKALVLHALALKGVLELEVYAENKLAVGFYRRLGFIETLRRDEDDEGRRQEVIRMRYQA